MSTGFTASQLQELENTFRARAPRRPVHADLGHALRANAISMTGTDKGVLMRIAFGAEAIENFFLNCIVALELMTGVNETALKFDWWQMQENEKGLYLPLPTRDELAQAFNIASLRIGPEPDGLLVNGTNGTEKRMIYLPRMLAREIFETINLCGEHDGWWDSDFILIPKPN